MAVLLTPVCAEMRGYDSDSSNLSCSTRRINSGLYCQYRLSCVHLKCPFTAKMDISIGNREREKRRFKLDGYVVSGKPPEFCALPFLVSFWNHKGSVWLSVA